MRLGAPNDAALMFGIRAGLKVRIRGYGNPELRAFVWMGDSVDEDPDHYQAKGGRNQRHCTEPPQAGKEIRRLG